MIPKEKVPADATDAAKTIVAMRHAFVRSPTRFVESEAFVAAAVDGAKEHGLIERKMGQHLRCRPFVFVIRCWT